MLVPLSPTIRELTPVWCYSFGTPEHIMDWALFHFHQSPEKIKGIKISQEGHFFSYGKMFLTRKLQSYYSHVGWDFILLLIKNKVIPIKYSDHSFPSFNSSQILSSSLHFQFHAFFMSIKKTDRQRQRKIRTNKRNK